MFAAVVALLGAWPAAVLPRTEKSFVSALEGALLSSEQLQAEVASGRVVGDFGRRAQKIVNTAVGAAGDFAPEEMERAADAALRGLFQQQLALLSLDLFERFRQPGRQSIEVTLARAAKVFQSRAAPLVRPGSDWSYEAEQDRLLEALSIELEHASNVVQERRRVVQTQRATADVVGKLQKQMEQLGENLRGMSTAGPWQLWTSYRLPGTPFQMSAKYQEGRTNIELNLTPNKDPANAATGMVEGLTKSNLGLSLDVGI